MKNDRISNGVYLVGAGPGDPELITVKGLKLIKKADVIVYDFLVNRKLLACAKKGAELICAGKSYLYHALEQDQINKLLAEKAKPAKIVIRLKNGDPFVFGRGAEEAIYLAEQNIPCQVISGVSSATAVPASCGVPLTHRDYASSVAIITGHRKKDKKVSPAPVCRSGVKFVNADTLVFLMTVTNLERITKNLIKNGKSPDTPCILIERGTLANQKAIQGNLGNILKKQKVKRIKPPAVFVVGEVVNLREVLNKPPQQKFCCGGKTKKKILFTGTDPRRFRHSGEILHQPMIKIIPLGDYSEVEKEIKRIDEYHWLIFTSRYGVNYFFDILAKSKEQRTKNFSRLLALLSPGLKICALGRATTNKLKEYGVRVDCIPKKESAQGIIEALKNFDLKGKNVLIPRSNLSSNAIPNALRKRGAYVKSMPVYRNIPPSRLKKIDINKIDEIIFTSPSTVKNFMAEYKDIPKRIKIRCIGDVTCAKLKNYGFRGEVIT